MGAFREMVRWGLKSTSALAANLALLTVWVDHVGVPPEAAVLINIPLITSVAYVLTDRWVFAAHASPESLLGHVKQYAGMMSVNLSGKVVNYILYVGLLRVIDYRVAWAIGAVVVFLYTFAGNREWWGRASHSEG